MPLACSRFLFFMASIAAALALAIAGYLEYSVGLAPCSLCVLQRMCLMLFLVNCLVASVHGPALRGSIAYGVTGLVFASGGLALAWRQVLLQGETTGQVFQCAPHTHATGSLWCAIRQVFQGPIDCASITWSLFDLSIAEWSLLFFLSLSLTLAAVLLRLVWNALIRRLSGQTSQFVRALD